MLSTLRRLVALYLCFTLCFFLAACSSGRAQPSAISPEDMAVIRRQAEGYQAAMVRLPELASLVGNRDWTYARNLIHGPMQEVGREMLYINKRLLPADLPEAEKRSQILKEALADLDEAARLQSADRLDKSYELVVKGFKSYAELIPAQALN